MDDDEQLPEHGGDTLNDTISEPSEGQSFVFPPPNVPPPMPPPPFVDWESVARFEKLVAEEDADPEGMTSWAKAILLNVGVVGLDEPDRWWWRTAAITMARKWMKTRTYLDRRK